MNRPPTYNPNGAFVPDDPPTRIKGGIAGLFDNMGNLILRMIGTTVYGIQKRLMR